MFFNLHLNVPLRGLITFFLMCFSTHLWASQGCSNYLGSEPISSQQLIEHTQKSIEKVEEFNFIKETADKMGLRVWLFGGTAASFLNYVKLDFQKQNGMRNFQNDRFDYDFTNIFRSTQDLDIVVDADIETIDEFQKTLAQAFPFFVGSKANKWEVRSLYSRRGEPGKWGFKEALLKDFDFNEQNTDSYSIGMVEITNANEAAKITDLKNWQRDKSDFLRDMLQGEVSYFRNPKHYETSRAKIGENPEILSVIRILVKAFQYEARFSKNQLETLKSIIHDFDTQSIENNVALRKILESSKKLVLHASDIEYAINTLDQLGLRKKLISLGDPNRIEDAAWWLNKEPLRSFSLSQDGFSGKTAQDLGIEIVAHETNSLLAHESITRSYDGRPNVFISRAGFPGENSAIVPQGFYTQIGQEGARGTGLTIRFQVHPEAREGVDFHYDPSLDYVIFYNKNVLSVIFESLELSIDQLLSLIERGESFEIDKSDLALFEKLKRRIKAKNIVDSVIELFDSGSYDKLRRILRGLVEGDNSQFLSKEVIESIFTLLDKKISHLLKDMNHEDQKYEFLVQKLGSFKVLAKLPSVISDHYEYNQILEQKLLSESTDLELRKFIFGEYVLTYRPSFSNLNKWINKYFSEQERTQVVQELSLWKKSNQKRMIDYVKDLYTEKMLAVHKIDSKKIEFLHTLDLFAVIDEAHLYIEEPVKVSFVKSQSKPSYDEIRTKKSFRISETYPISFLIDHESHFDRFKNILKEQNKVYRVISSIHSENRGHSLSSYGHERLDSDTHMLFFTSFLIDAYFKKDFASINNFFRGLSLPYYSRNYLDQIKKIVNAFYKVVFSLEHESKNKYELYFETIRHIEFIDLRKDLYKEEYIGFLKNLIEDGKSSFSNKKWAFQELMHHNPDFETLKYMKSVLSEDELDVLIDEVNSWFKSDKGEEVILAERFFANFMKIIQVDDVATLDELYKEGLLEFIDINYVMKREHEPIVDRNLTPLMMAARSNAHKVTHFLLNSFSDININFTVEGVNTALREAASSNSVEAARILLAHPEIDVNVHIKSEKFDYVKTTALFNAINSNSIEIVKMLASRSETILTSTEGNFLTPLTLATRYDKIEIFKILYEALGYEGVDLTKNRRHQSNLLVHAALCNSPRVLKFILDQSGVDVNTFDQTGMIYGALHWVAERHKDGEGLVLDLLLNHPEIDVNLKSGERGLPPLITAMATSGKIDFIKRILKRKDLDVNAQTRGGNTAAMAALLSYKNHRGRSGMKEMVEKKLALLIQHPDFDMSIKNNKGESFQDLLKETGIDLDSLMSRKPY